MGKRKDKKAKKSHKKKRRTDSGSKAADSSSDESDGWEEVGATPSEPASSTTAAGGGSGAQRDDWMLKPPPKQKAPTPVLEEKAAEPAKPVISDKELNPHWRSNGTGLPEREPSDQRPTPSVRVGDGGASWRARALKRAQERAAEEGRPLDEVIGERADPAALLAEQQRRERRRDEHRRPRHDERRPRSDERRRDDDERRRDGSSRQYLRRPERDEPRFARPDHEHDAAEHDEFGRQRRRQEPDRETHVHSPRRGAFPTSRNDALEGGTARESSGEQSAPVPATREPEVAAATPAVAMKPPPDLNKLEASLLRAEMRDDAEAVAKLKAKITLAKQAHKAFAQQSLALQRPGLANSSTQSALTGRAAKKERQHGTHDAKTGERQRYYADDDDVDLNTLVQREKMATAGQYDRNYARNVVKQGKFNMQRELEERGELLFESKGGANNGGRPALHRGNDPTESCGRCPGSTRARAAAHLVIARGTRAYLALPTRGPLVPGHCVIAPIDHVASVVGADEDVYTEIRNFQKCLIRMFDALDQEVVFFETVGSLHQSRHTLVECVPMARRDAAVAPGYFRKALSESEVEDEWSQHKKVLPVSALKGVRKAIPPQFCYFYVQFALGDGLAHIIHDNRDFGQGFARGVLAGLLELDDDAWMGRPRAETRAADLKRVATFKQQYAPFDWTVALRDESALAALNADAVTAPRKPAASVARQEEDVISQLRQGSRIDE